MPPHLSESRNWFAQGGQAYARFRPEYPAPLAAYLAALAPDKQLAVDVGCGSGQLTGLLAQHFRKVLGVDTSADQLAHAEPHARITYQCAPAEQLPVGDRSVGLIAAAQAAHWFDLPGFYREVRRVLAPGGVLALISYGVLQLEPALQARFQHFYVQEIGPFWPPERKLVDSGYADIDFPLVEQLDKPAFTMERSWSLVEFLGYLSTWSSVRRAQELGQQAVLQQFAQELVGLWGESQRRRTIRWPIAMRIGRC